MNSNTVCSISVNIPVTAIPVKVTNIQNPHVMRIFEIKEYFEKLDRINRKLLSFVKSKKFLKGKSSTQDPKIGDVGIYSISFDLQYEVNWM